MPLRFTCKIAPAPSGVSTCWTLEYQHQRERQALKLPADAVIHSFQHTFGTGLGQTGADAFTIMKVMGHSTVEIRKLI